MLADDQLRPAIHFRGEVWRWAKRKPGDPIAVPDQRMLAQMKQRDVFADREVANPRVRLHHETVRQNPRETDPRARVNLVAKMPDE